MKFINIKTSLVFLSLVVAIPGCLKDEDVSSGTYNINLDNAQSFAQILGTVAGDPRLVVNLEYSTNDTTFYGVTLSITADKPVARDVKVTLVADTSLISAYNRKHGTAYTELPAANYTLPNGLDVTIPAGQREGTLDIKAKPSFIATGVYALAYRIAAVSDPAVGISNNFKEIVVAMGVKNKYDGIYTFRGRMDIPSDRSPDWVRTPFTYPYEVHLITTGSNTVKFYNTAFGAGFHPLMTPATSGFGQTEATFTFDENDNITNVVNTYSPVTNGRAYDFNSGVTGSKYDAASKSVYATYRMTQTGFQPMTLYDTLIYLRPR